MRGLRLALAVLFTPIAGGLALVSLAGAAAAQLGRWDSRFDLAAQVAPFWLAGGIVALILSVFLGKGFRALTVLASLLAIGGAAWLIVPEFTRDAGPTASASAPGQVKIIQVNLRGRDDSETLEWLIAEDPDFIMGEEFTKTFSRKLVERTGRHIACQTCGLMVLSKRPARAEVGAWAKGSKGIVIDDPAGPFVVFAVEYHRPSVAGNQEPQEQFLSTLLDQQGNNSRTIVAGDMNSSPWTFQRRRWDAVFPVIRRDRALFTWPARPYERFRFAPFPFFAISHVYAGPGWATVSVKRGPKLQSDHYPIVTILAPVQ